MADDTRKKVKVAPYIDAHFLSSHAQLFEHSERSTDLVSRVVTNLGTLLGIEFVARIPPHLTRFMMKDKEFLRGIRTLNTMYSLGFIKDWHRVTQAYPDEPRLIAYSVRINHRYPQKGVSARTGAGFSFHSDTEALWAAIGEALERYMFFNFRPEQKQLTNSSFKDLENALDIFTLAGIDSKTRRKKYKNITLDFNSETPFTWVRGHSLTYEKKIWAPLQLATSSPHTTGTNYEQEPVLRPLVSTGATVHQTRERALVGGILELIERDAFMITWLNKLSPPLIAPATIPDHVTQDLLASLNRYHLKPYIVHLPSDFPVHVILALIVDMTGIGPRVIVGASASFNLQQAIRDALVESVATRMFQRSSLDNAKGADETLSQLRQRFSVFSKSDRLLYWSRVKDLRDIEFLTQGGEKSHESFLNYTKISARESELEHLINTFKTKQLELAYVDWLRPDVMRKLGLYGAMVIAPELQPLHLSEKVPFMWGRRLRAVPKCLGYQTAKKLNPVPHPFP